MVEVILLAIALSMVAFAVSIGLGAKRIQNTTVLAFKAGIYFGVFQAIMPLIGHFAGIGLVQYVEQVDHWIAFGLLVLIGGKMIFESIKGDASEDISALSLQMDFKYVPYARFVSRHPPNSLAGTHLDLFAGGMRSPATPLLV